MGNAWDFNLSNTLYLESFTETQEMMRNRFGSENQELTVLSLKSNVDVKEDFVYTGRAT